jgi:alanine racemase
MTMPLCAKPLWMEIDPAALAHNYREIQRRAGPGVEIIGSVKADAYGHGAVAVANILAPLGVHALATGSFDDAVAMRNAGINLRIIMFGGNLPEGIGDLLRHNLVPTVSDMASAKALSRCAVRPTSCYVKIDSGFGRLGIPIEEAVSFVTKIARLPRVVVGGLYTHLPFADAAGEAWARRQTAAFERAVQTLRARGITIPVTQAIASSGLVAGIKSTCNAVCPGHILYGLSPFAPNATRQGPFKPVLRSIKTSLIHVVRHDRRRQSGVGGKRTVRAGSVTGVVPLGISDGYQGSRQTNAPRMLVRGKQVPVIGVSLEYATLDLSAVRGAEIGDEVVAVGTDGRETIALEQVAAWQARSALETMISFARRIRQSAAHLDVSGASRSRKASSLRSVGQVITGGRPR